MDNVWKEGWSDEVSSTASQVGQKTLDQLNEQKDKMAGKLDDAAGTIYAVADTASERAKGVGHWAASKLDDAAAKMHKTADSGSQRVSGMGHSAADAVQSTASFLREHDTRQMVGGLEDLIRKYPAKSLLIAVAAGFIAGRALKHD